jgi:hypothetical protein
MGSFFKLSVSRLCMDKNDTFMSRIMTATVLYQLIIHPEKLVVHALIFLQWVLGHYPSETMHNSLLLLILENRAPKFHSYTVLD